MIKTRILGGLAGLLLAGTSALAGDPLLNIYEAAGLATQNRALQDGDPKEYIKGVQIENGAKLTDLVTGASARRARNEMEEALKRDSDEESSDREQNDVQVNRSSGNDKDTNWRTLKHGVYNINLPSPGNSMGICGSYRDINKNGSFDSVEERGKEQDSFTREDTLYLVMTLHGSLWPRKSYISVYRLDKQKRRTRDGYIETEKEDYIVKSRKTVIPANTDMVKILPYDLRRFKPGVYVVHFSVDGVGGDDSLAIIEKSFLVTEEDKSTSSENKPVRAEDSAGKVEKVSFQ